MFIGRLGILFNKVSIQVFCLFYQIAIFFLPHWLCRSSLYILDKSLFLDKCNTSVLSVDCVLIPYGVIWWTEVYNFNIVKYNQFFLLWWVFCIGLWKKFCLLKVMKMFYFFYFINLPFIQIYNPFGIYFCVRYVVVRLHIEEHKKPKLQEFI